MADLIDIQILEDGKLSIKTEGISDRNHADADDLLNLLEEAMGGERTTTKLKHKHIHHKVHTHVHA